ncbi:MAG: T9SS type A sorting domain-containing protein [Flavobacteriaceae bacterium]|nr:T9SS type A sorting domain-containing protein [Flavobacteriaceae bacterium]
MKTMITFLMLIVCSITFAQDKIYIHTATPENTAGHITYIDHPDLNGNPDAGIVYVHNWNPGGLGGTFNNNTTGLWYDGASWTIFNEDTAVSMVENSSYNIYIADTSNVITHVSDSSNEGSFGNHTTVIDNAAFNSSNPGPYAMLSNYWNPNSIYNNQAYGFYYDVDLDKRGIYQEDANLIPDGAAFKVLIAGSDATRFTHITSIDNISNNWTIIDHVSLNGNPDATFVFTHYWGVGGVTTEVDLNAVLGVWYDGANWSIYNEAGGGSDMFEGLAFDIAVVDQEILGIEENSLVDISVKMYPNPANNEVTISSEYTINNITLFNVLGQEIFQSKHDSNSIDIDLSNYTRGSYFVNVEMESTTKTLKLIKN